MVSVLWKLAALNMEWVGHGLAHGAQLLVLVVLVVPFGACNSALGPGHSAYGAVGPGLLQVVAVEDPAAAILLAAWKHQAPRDVVWKVNPRLGLGCLILGHGRRLGGLGCLHGLHGLHRHGLHRFRGLHRLHDGLHRHGLHHLHGLHCLQGLHGLHVLLASFGWSLGHGLEADWKRS